MYKKNIDTGIEALGGGSGNGREPFVINGKGDGLGGHGHTERCSL